ncbi:MAG TPA: nuclear transport factor 2 family protein [Novosphingobium sp.]|nr:nuclear transport factor 2 family protein [Novosphingobium sp.]
MRATLRRANATPGSAAAIVRSFIGQVDRGDVAECAVLMHPDIRYCDAKGGTLVGWSDCMELVRGVAYRLSRKSVEILALANWGNRVKLRLRTGAADERFNGLACWTVRVEHGLVRDIEVRREDGLETIRILVPDLYEREAGAISGR